MPNNSSRQRRNKIKCVRDWVEVISGCVTAAAIVIGGVWAWYTFDYQRQVERERYEKEHSADLQITVEPKVVDYKDRVKLLLVNVCLKNVGHERVLPSPRGCLLRVWKMHGQDSVNEALAWGERKLIVRDKDFLDGYGTYVVKPGIEYHEVEPVLVEEGALYLIRVRFYSQSETITEYRFIHIPKGK